MARRRRHSPPTGQPALLVAGAASYNAHSMRFFVGVTDYDWFLLHASRSSAEEVNFWKPSSGVPFKALQTGEPFLFKLHAPRNFIAGGVSLPST
jgi:hypothetical protein